jgi:hypothetical protein
VKALPGAPADLTRNPKPGARDATPKPTLFSLNVLPQRSPSTFSLNVLPQRSRGTTLRAALSMPHPHRAAGDPYRAAQPTRTDVRPEHCPGGRPLGGETSQISLILSETEGKARNDCCYE